LPAAVKESKMPKFVIEREMPGAGSLSGEELCAASRKSADVLHQLGSVVHWQQSYVTDEKVICVWVAENEDAIREHARRSGFPVTAIRRVTAVIDPSTGEG
jgi:hypothetical protein